MISALMYLIKTLYTQLSNYLLSFL